jgi:hypothetical protein
MNWGMMDKTDLIMEKDQRREEEEAEADPSPL